MIRSSACGMMMSLPPASATFGNLFPVHNGARADQHFVTEAFRQPDDAGERFGRVQRNFDDAKNRFPTNTVPMSSASPGLMPRRIAISGQRFEPAGKGFGCHFLRRDASRNSPWVTALESSVLDSNPSTSSA